MPGIVAPAMPAKMPSPATAPRPIQVVSELSRLNAAPRAITLSSTLLPILHR